MKKLAILGSTGSIGTQTLQVVKEHLEHFKASLLCANNSVKTLAAQALEFGADDAVICNPEHYDTLVSLLEGSAVRPHCGMDAVCELVGTEDIDCVVASMVGFSGLRSTVAAIKAGKRLALANKETLVAAGSIITALLEQYPEAELIPVDSEHSAIFQCLEGSLGDKVAKIHLTASGGPFRTWSREKIAACTAADALKHPNWNMGAKVTIDSATLMNKGLEMIEARWLFDIDPKDINIVVHPESIIHSMVAFEDGAVIAQLGYPDMREPIQYALSYPHRLSLSNPKLDFFSLGSLNFEKPDLERFPCLGLAFEAIGRRGLVPTAMNAANEVAVKAFLEGKISFYGIADLIERTMARVPDTGSVSLEDIYEADAEYKRIAEELL